MQLIACCVNMLLVFCPSTFAVTFYTGLDDSWALSTIFADATDFPFGMYVMFYETNNETLTMDPNE